MFRAAAAGPYDEAINKATDENLTSEDWGAIMEVCDRVATDANGAKEAVNSMIKRLAHRNANVQLYTLEVANALSQNCGKNMHRELSSRAFTDALLKLANDRNTHTQVKAKILERMKEWSDMFKSDPDLGIMYDAYYRLKQSNPTLHPPSAPQKNVLTDADRQKEEEELQMALQLSLQEEERKKGGGGRPAGGAAASSSGAAAAGPSNNAGGRTNSTAGQADAAATPQPVPSGTTAATVSRVRALYDFVPSEPGELEFKKGDVIAVLESVYKDWWRGSLKGKTGIFPLNYVEKLTDPTPEELQREAQMEAEVFAEIKNVEKLLTLLSAGNTGPREEDNEEISKLYHQTLAIRPKLIKLIEKYSQKKDDFTQLNEKFIKARRDYEALLESSMSHLPGPSYHQYAMRPPMTNSYGAGGYGAPPPQQQQQEPPRFYTPAPAQDAPQYPTTSPSPNPNHFIRPAGTPAPYHMGGTEGPGQYQQQTPYPQQQQQQPAYGGPSRPQDQRIPSGSNNPMVPAPLNTTSSPPPGNQYTPYQPPGASGGNNRTNSYSSANGGAPQELSTSAYDSPIAQHSTNPLSNPSYNAPSAPSYNQGPSGAPNDDPYAPASPTATAPGAGPSGNVGSAPPVPSGPAPSAPSAPLAPSAPSAPSAPGGGYAQGGYHSQNPYQAAATAAAAAASSRPHAGGYEGAGSEVSTTAPQAPTALQPGVGAAQHQYKAYVPPGSAPSAPGGQDGPSAPGAPGQGQQGQNDGLADYYRSAY